MNNTEQTAGTSAMLPISRDALVDLIAAGLRGTYHCTRVWDAWSVGTMSQQDFEPVDESDTPGEIADAVLTLLAAAPAAVASVPVGYVAVPKRLTRAMQRVLAEEGWDWSDVLTAAEVLTEAEEESIRRYDSLEAIEKLEEGAQPQADAAEPITRDDFADLVVQEACETDPADPDDPETIKIRTHDLRWAVLAAFRSAQSAQPAPQALGAAEHHGLDTGDRVCFYEQDFYVLSNFSSFTLEWQGRRFDTSEAAYHWEKFVGKPDLMTAIQYAPSAHEAFKIAERNKVHRRADWDAVKVGIMRGILRAKADQHEYVRRKLLATGDRELVENSWRDDYWGWGPNRDGLNMLGKLWMEVRAELRAAAMPVEPDRRRDCSQGCNGCEACTDDDAPLETGEGDAR